MPITSSFRVLLERKERCDFCNKIEEEEGRLDIRVKCEFRPKSIGGRFASLKENPPIETKFVQKKTSLVLSLEPFAQSQREGKESRLYMSYPSMVATDLYKD